MNGCGWLTIPLTFTIADIPFAASSTNIIHCSTSFALERGCSVERRSDVCQTCIILSNVFLAVGAKVSSQRAWMGLPIHARWDETFAPTVHKPWVYRSARIEIAQKVDERQLTKRTI